MKLEPADIEQVEVATYRAGLEVAHYEAPRTPAEGRFSLKYVVATALSHGSVRLAAFEPDRLRHPVTQGPVEKIKVTVDPEIESRFGQALGARRDPREGSARGVAAADPASAIRTRRSRIACWRRSISSLPRRFSVKPRRARS